MRILVLGGDGMLGHALVGAWRARHDVHATLRRDREAYRGEELLLRPESHFGVDVRRLDDVVDVLGEVRPEAVVNAAGIVKQRRSAGDAVASLEVNALFPHRLARACRAAGARLVHVSTDCVFSGTRGRYTEQDEPDARDLYGRTKLLGEVHEPRCLTLRTSIVGLELTRKTGLVEWYLAQRGAIRGYRRAIFSGVTTAELAGAVEHLLLRERDLDGLWHLASEPISKYDLLAGLGERLRRRDVELRPDVELACDRSLDASALRRRTSYRPPPWNTMLDRLAAEIEERNLAP